MIVENKNKQRKYRLMYNDFASKLPFLPPSKQDATHEDSLDLCWWLFSKLLLQKRVALCDAVVVAVRISGKLVWLYEVGPSETETKYVKLRNSSL